MSGLNTTIAARDALRAVIRDRYGQDIRGDGWLTKSPSGAPPEEGLGSGDAIDWLVSLDNASAKMARKGYRMTEIGRLEASEQRNAKLTGSVALLVSKASKEKRALGRRNGRKLTLFLGSGTLLAVAVGYLTKRLAHGDDR